MSSTLESSRLGTQCSLSVVVPLYNEAENVGPLAEWIQEALRDTAGTYEAILVDDGSTDETWAGIRAVCERYAGFRGVRLRANAGQTAAMMAGFDHACGEVIVSLDGDLQNDPRDIPMLIEKLNEGYDLVCGWRQGRKDKVLLRKIPSFIANRLIRRLTGVSIRDNGCSLKAYRADLLKRLNLYSDQHRFIPALSASSGARITEVPVRHHARRFGQSKYGISRTFKVIVDLLTLKMVTTFRQRPLLGFSVALTPLLLLAGIFVSAWLIAFTQFGPGKANALVLPGAALLWLGAATYLFLLGLISEVALRSDSENINSTPFVRDA